MEINIKKLFLAIIILILTNGNYAATTSSSQHDTQPPISANQNNLLTYLDQVLSDAGFNDAAKMYLINMARLQISQINSYNLEEKTRLLKRNLYIFLEAQSQTNMTAAAANIIQTEYHLAEQYKEPWNYILSKEILSKFKANHIFDQITVEDIKNSNSKFCQIWPFCDDN